MNILRHGNISELTASESINPKLPAGTYDLQINPRSGELELHHRPSFKMPNKIYGGHDRFSERCLHTFSKMGKGMAVLLSGPKGCGKTLTAKDIAIKSKMPVICITAGFGGPQFTGFLTELPNPCVIFIDEFEKVYDRQDERNMFLALLDGSTDNKHLFILTSNSEDIGEYFSNRPGRVRYHRKYTELDPQVLKEMVDDNMPKGKLRSSVHQFLDEMGSVSPDVLMSLIQECLIHNEPPATFLPFFNIQTELSGYYDVEVEIMTPVPRPGLTKAKAAKASNYAFVVRDESKRYADKHYPGDGKLCEWKTRVWTARYIKPFDNHTQEPGKISADIHYAQCKDDSRSFHIRPNHIKDIQRVKGRLIITTQDQTVYRFKKAAPYRAAY